MVTLFENFMSNKTGGEKPGSAATMYSSSKSRKSRLEKTEKLKRLKSFSPSEESELPDKILIKGDDKRPKRLFKDETEEQKRYTALVKQYSESTVQSARRPPKINYGELLRSISGKIGELDDTKQRYERIRRRIRGKFDRYIWNMDEVIKKVEDAHHMARANQLKKKDVVIEGLEEMSAGEVRASLQADVCAKQNENRIVPILSKKLVENNRTRLIFQKHVTNCLAVVKQDLKVTLGEVSTENKPSSGTQARC